MQDAVAANGAGGQAAALSEFGRRWGTAAMFEAARAANENTPKLKTFDTKGFRRDTVEFHPAYHDFMAESIAAGLQSSTWCNETWRDEAKPAPAPAQVTRAARLHGGTDRDRASLPITVRAAVAALAASRRWCPAGA